MRQIHVAIAIIHQSGKVLICQRRKNDSFGGLWEFPGGKVEQGETPSQCLARELQEELGVQVRIVDTFRPIDHRYPNVTVRLFPHLCIEPTAVPRPLAADQLEWVPISCLRDYRFPAGNAGLIDEVIDRLQCQENSPS